MKLKLSIVATIVVAILATTVSLWHSLQTSSVQPSTVEFITCDPALPASVYQIAGHGKNPTIITCEQHFVPKFSVHKDYGAVRGHFNCTYEDGPEDGESLNGQDTVTLSTIMDQRVRLRHRCMLPLDGDNLLNTFAFQRSNYFDALAKRRVATVFTSGSEATAPFTEMVLPRSSVLLRALHGNVTVEFFQPSMVLEYCPRSSSKEIAPCVQGKRLKPEPVLSIPLSGGMLLSIPQFQPYRVVSYADISVIVEATSHFTPIPPLGDKNDTLEPVDVSLLTAVFPYSAQAARQVYHRRLMSAAKHHDPLFLRGWSGEGVELLKVDLNDKGFSDGDNVITAFLADVAWFE